MLAKVVEGRKIGRTIGFPTANLDFFNPDEMPESGVYEVDVAPEGVPKEQVFRGVLNVGCRPTFGVSQKVAEVHILDFDQNIYGETLSINIRKFLRNERPFSTPEALKKQIEKDIAEAQKSL